MNVLAISDVGELLPVAERIHNEGHRVTLHINNHEYALRGRGHVDQRTAHIGSIVSGTHVNVGKAKRLLREIKPDIVLLDLGVAALADVAREWGAKVWGADRWARLLSTQIGYARTLIKYGDIDTSWHDELESVLKKESSTVTSAAWWDGETLLYPHVLVQEHEMNVVQASVALPIGIHSKLAQTTLVRLPKLLKKVSYRGPVYCGSTLSAGYAVDEVALISELAHGELVRAMSGKGIRYIPDMALVNHITLPPFPKQDDDIHCKVPIKLEDGAKKHVWLVDYYNGSTAAIDGDLGWVAAHGTSLAESAKRVNRTIGRLNIDILQYRTDAGIHAERVLSAIRDLGLL